MLRYKLKYLNMNPINEDDKVIIKTQYKCLICGYIHDWDDTWTTEKKEEVKLEVDKHHDDHIVPQT
jgi:hypothetical protein